MTKKTKSIDEIEEKDRKKDKRKDRKKDKRKDRKKDKRKDRKKDKRKDRKKDCSYKKETFNDSLLTSYSVSLMETSAPLF